jgi:hypothetical protein
MKKSRNPSKYCFKHFNIKKAKVKNPSKEKEKSRFKVEGPKERNFKKG